MKKTNNPMTVLLISGFCILQGCGSVGIDEYLPDKKVEYKKSEQAGRDLEVPPDLTHIRAGSDLYVPEAVGASGVATYSQFLGEKQIAGQTSSLANANIMPSVDNIVMKREGKERWLVIDASPQIVWPNVVSFWQDNGILLLEQDPTVGVMKTGWLENRADIGSDFITRNIRKVFDGLYSTATRDQYRVRLEEGDEPGTTELYLTHFGMEEKIKVDTAGEAERSIWVPRDSETGLEAEMLRRLMVHLGVSEKRAAVLVEQKAAEREKRSELVRNSTEKKLLVDESFAKTWRLAGLALDRVGFAVEDRDRSKGIYYVKYSDPLADVETDEGWLSKLKFWGGGNNIEQDDRYQVAVRAGDNKTEIAVLNEQGQELSTDTAGRILTLIHEQIQ